MQKTMHVAIESFGFSLPTFDLRCKSWVSKNHSNSLQNMTFSSAFLSQIVDYDGVEL
jgi:hypothetical protein